jgi:hypothetical protein
MVPLLPLDGLLKLIDKAIDFLRENERQRKRFFDEVVKPLETVFDELYTGHLAAFAQTREMILQGRGADEIIAYVRGRILFEQNVPDLLKRLTRLGEEADWRQIPSGNGLKEHFTLHVEKIASCLRSPKEPSEPQVGYYVALDDVTQHLSAVGRERSLNDLERIVGRFQHYHADVKESYIRLQRFCAS